MADTIRWGILGTGSIASQFTGDLVIAGRTVTAVGSRSQATADEFAARFGIPTAHPSYEALVADPNVDAIYVSTPNTLHFANARLALLGGKHVLLEKPFTMDAAEARDLVELAAERNLVLLEAMWTRWLPHMIRVREIIASGAIGEVRTVIADHNQLLPDDPLNRWHNPDLGGGALLDLGIYPISFAWDLLGKPASVSAIAAMTDTDVDRQTAILFGYPDGQQALLHASLDSPGPNHASILGTRGRIDIDSIWFMPTTFTVFDADGVATERYDRPIVGRGMQFEALAVEEIITSGRIEGVEMPPHETVEIMQTLDEIRRQIGLHFPGER